MERCPSGLRGLPAKEVNRGICFAGSNPALSAGREKRLRRVTSLDIETHTQLDLFSRVPHFYPKHTQKGESHQSPYSSTG